MWSGPERHRRGLDVGRQCMVTHLEEEEGLRAEPHRENADGVDPSRMDGASLNGGR